MARWLGEYGEMKAKRKLPKSRVYTGAESSMEKRVKTFVSLVAADSLKRVQLKVPEAIRQSWTGKIDEVVRNGKVHITIVLKHRERGKIEIVAEAGHQINHGLGSRHVAEVGRLLGDTLASKLERFNPVAFSAAQASDSSIPAPTPPTTMNDLYEIEHELTMDPVEVARLKVIEEDKYPEWD